jgi:hypothetical protein
MREPRRIAAHHAGGAKMRPSGSRLNFGAAQPTFKMAFDFGLR